MNDSDTLEQSLARVLASALVVRRHALQSFLLEDLGQHDETALERAADRLLSRPFVERMADGVRVAEPMAAAVRNWFHESDPDGYVMVNRRLLGDEIAAMEDREDETERWFARGRVAFYLAAIDPAESAESFIETFAEPPPGDVGPWRSWLADLVLKQRDRLTGQARALNFFEGFTAYKDGRFRVAQEHLEAVIESAEQDRYRAIALHLWSLIRDRDPRVDSRLREAVELSAQLGLAENEVMARNTLVFRLIGQGYAKKRHWDPAIAEAAMLADANLARAETTRDPYLQAWCRSAAAQSRWLRDTDSRRRPDLVSDEDAEQVIGLLAVATDQALRIGDIHSVVESVNESAQILRDRGQHGRAVSILEDYFYRIRDLDPPPSARRWGQTASSIARQRLDEGTRGRLRRLQGLLREWNPPASRS